MRILGSVLGWLLFGFGAALVGAASTTASGIGLFCAAGRVQLVPASCAAASGWMLTLGVVTALVGVLFGTVLARGFGMPLPSWALPIGLVVIGVGVALSFSLVPLIVGGALLLVALGLFATELRAGAARLLTGTVDASGNGFSTRGQRRSLTYRPQGRPEHGERKRHRPRATAADGLMAVGIAVAVAGAGVAAALVLFFQLGAPATGPVTPSPDGDTAFSLES